MDPWTFWLGGAVALGGGLMTVSSRHAVASVLWLVLAFLGMATLFFGMDAGFVGVLQILVYAGAIMILFLFVIMLLNLTPVGLLRSDRKSFKALGLVSGVVFVALVTSVVVTGRLWTRGGTEQAIMERTTSDTLVRGDALSIADQLFNAHVLPFEAASVLLLIAILGAVVLTKRKLS